MRSVPITFKVNLLILVSLTIGIGSITVYLGWSLAETIDESTRSALEQESGIVYEAIEQLMMPGEAPLVVSYFQGIGDLDPRLRIYLYRTDGTPAFSDSETIDIVNGELDFPLFARRAEGTSETMAPPFADTERFAQATSRPVRTAIFQDEVDGTTTIQYLQPLLNLPKCTVCHGSDHTIRGVIELRSDISESIARQRTAIVSASGTFLLLVTVVGFLMSRYLRRQVILPLREIGATCEQVTMGNFDRRSTVRNNDELGALSATVNRMVEGLYERFVLSRFVSGSTIASLGGAQESRSEELTFLFSDIRGFTAFTERNDPKTVVDTLNSVLGDQSEVIARFGGDIDKYVGDEIVAVFSGEDGVVRAARAATAIQTMLEGADEERYRGLHVGIGINSGSVVVGAIGGRRRADFTAVGDNVNVTARLCSGAARGEILVSDIVRSSLTERGASLEGPFRMKVKGKAEALRVFKLTAMPDDDGDSEDTP